MKKSKFVFFTITFAFAVLLLNGCAEKPPVMPDGESTIILKAYWNKSESASDTVYAPMAKAKVIISSEYGLMIRYTDENGMLELTGLPTALYNISIRMQHPNTPGILLVGSKLSIESFNGKPVTETIYAKAVSNSGISINEIYAAGPENNQFYFYDQFIELYNSSDSTKFLDGMMVMRVSGNTAAGFKGPGADEDNDGDIDGIVYVFKFPGNPGEQNYPIAPKQFITIAGQAQDHRKYIPKSIDLSNADWEFYNQFSSIDIDNPKVPNLLSMRSDITTDFLIGITGDIIVISNGKDTNWQDGIDISTIIDGVEYQQTALDRKTLDSRVDRGFVLAPPRYSGKSIQRRDPGGDSNDGGLDWEILAHPTPGYQ